MIHNATMRQECVGCGGEDGDGNYDDRGAGEVNPDRDRKRNRNRNSSSSSNNGNNDRAGGDGGDD
jgi:hypothetical protein